MLVPAHLRASVFFWRDGRTIQNQSRVAPDVPKKELLASGGALLPGRYVEKDPPTLLPTLFEVLPQRSVDMGWAGGSNPEDR